MSGFTCIMIGGPDHEIEVGGKRYQFEMHPHLGPLPLNRRTGGEICLGPKHKFWTAATHWVEQGKRVDDQGLCVWEIPDPLKGCVHIGGRHWLYVGEKTLDEALTRMSDKMRNAVTACLAAERRSE